MANIGTLYAKIGADTRGLRTSLTKAERRFRRFSTTMTKGLAAVQKHWIALAATAAAVTLTLKKSYNEAKHFETALVDMGKVTDRSLGVMKKEVMELPAVLGSATDLMRGYYQVISAGVTEPVAAIKLLVTAAQTANAAHITQAEVIKGLTKVMRGYGGELNAVSDAADLLFSMEKAGQTEVRELVPVIGGLAKMSHETGVSINEMGAALSLMTQTAGDTAEASTQYRMILMALLKPMGALKTALKDLHYTSGVAMVKELGLANTFKTLTAYMRENNIAMGDMFESQRGLLGLLSLMENNFGEFENKIEELSKKTGMADKAFKDWSKTMAATGQIFWNTIGKLLIRFGTYIAPAVQSAMLAIVDAIESNLDGIVRFSKGALSAFGALWKVMSAMPVGLISYFDNVQKELAETAEEADKLKESFTPPDMTTWDVVFTDIKNAVRGLVLMAKGVGAIFGLMVGDVMEVFKLLARELWAVAGMIEGVLTLDVSKVKKSWNEVGAVWDDYGKRTSANWEAFAKTTENNWDTMIEGMRSEVDSIELIEPIIKKAKAAQKPAEAAGAEVGKAFAKAMTDEMIKAESMATDWYLAVMDLEKELTRSLLSEKDQRIAAIQDEYDAKMQIVEASFQKAEWIDKQLLKLEEWKIQEIKNVNEDAAKDTSDIWKDLFLSASEDNFDGFLNSIENKLKNFAANVAAGIFADMASNLFSGKDITGVLGEVTGEASTAGTIGKMAASKSTGMFSSAVGAFKGAVSKFGASTVTLGAVGIALAGIGAGLNRTEYGGPGGGSGWLGGLKEGNENMKGTGPIGQWLGAGTGAFLGLFGIHPFGAGERKRMDENIKQVEEYWDEYEKIMKKGYSSIAALASDFDAMISHDHIRALHALGEVDENTAATLYVFADALRALKDEAEGAFAVSVDSMRRMNTAGGLLLKTLSGEQVERATNLIKKMNEQFKADFMEDFAKGLYSASDAIQQLMRMGMDQLDAQTELFGEDYAEMMLMLRGGIPVIDATSEKFNELYETLDDLDALVADIPDKYEDLKKSLTEVAYAIRYLTNMSQSLINMFEDLDKLPDIIDSLNNAIKQGDWDQAAQDLQSLSNQAINAASAFTQLAEAANYLGLAQLGNVAGWLGQLLTGLAALIAIGKFIGQVLKAIGEFLGIIQKESDLVIDEFELWQKQLEDMEDSGVISYVTDGLREWQRIIDEFNLGTVRSDMNALLTDFVKQKMALDELLERELITPKEYGAAWMDLMAAMRISINEYFDDLLEGFQDFRDTLKRDMQGLTKEGRTAADVTADIFKVFKEMGGLRGYDISMDPDEYLANAEEMRSLILERYEIEKKGIEESIAKLTEYRDAWEAAAKSIKDILLSITTGGLNPAAGVDSIGGMLDNVNRLRALYEGESGVEKAGYAAELAAALQDYLTMAEDTYSRPSTAYKQIYDAVVTELKELQNIAENKVSFADALLIKLEERLVKLQEDTIKELQWLDNNIATAMGVINEARDLALGSISGDIEAIKEDMFNTRLNTATTGQQLVTANEYLYDIVTNGIKIKGGGLETNNNPTAIPVPNIGPYGGSNVSFSVGDIIIQAGEGANGEEIANSVMSKIEDEVNYGRFGKVIIEKVKSAA